MAKIMITGITGYIGSQLASYLLNENQVYGLVRMPLNTTYLNENTQYDLVLLPYDGTFESVLDAMQKVQPDIVYHLATYYIGTHSPKDIALLMESNLKFGLYVIEAMLNCGCNKLVYASTSTTHNSEQNYRPFSLYAATKQAFTDMVEFYTNNRKLYAGAVVLSDTYGPKDKRPKVLNLVRDAVLSGSTLDLTSGIQIYDALYIDDVIRAFICTADALGNNNKTSHLLFQPSALQQYTLRETVELFLNINNLKLNANWGARPEPSVLLTEKIRLYSWPLNWKPLVSLEEGLQLFWNN